MDTAAQSAQIFLSIDCCEAHDRRKKPVWVSLPVAGETHNRQPKFHENLRASREFTAEFAYNGVLNIIDESSLKRFFDPIADVQIIWPLRLSI
jgi:hypothetical protein